MADPFLLAHQVGPRFFDLSGKLNPISIRDQMIRARLLVERARSAQLIDSVSPLLVVGSGACGATAALHVADADVPTILIDHAPVLPAGPDLFHVQHNCKTRWIDPTQYDWPTDHWGGGTFPWTGANMLLPWSAGRAHDVARKWIVDFAAECARLGGLLTVWFDARIAWPPAHHNNKVHMIVNRSGVDEKLMLGMVIVASGGGSEITTVGAFQGHRFWEDDPFETAHSGVPHGRGDQVVISGSGDGALQDFLRVATRKASAREVFEGCFDGAPPEFVRSIEHAILSAEARLRGAFHWGPSGRFDHDVHEELQAYHLRQVAVALGESQVRKNLDHLLRDMPDRLTLLHRCSHLSCFYPLNRFLVLLIAEHWKRNDELIRSRVSVHAITPIHHVCTGAAACLGENRFSTTLAEKRNATEGVPYRRGAIPCRERPPWRSGARRISNSGGEPENHLLDLVSFPRSWEPAGPPIPDRIQTNVVIVRHGINSTAIPWFSLTPLANYRQILPTHLH